MKNKIHISGILSVIFSVAFNALSYSQGVWELGDASKIGTTSKIVGIGVYPPQTTTKLDIYRSSGSLTGYNYCAVSTNSLAATNIAAQLNSRLGNASNYTGYATGYGMMGYVYNVTTIKASAGSTSTLTGGNFYLSLSSPVMDLAGTYKISGCMATLTGTISSYPSNKVFAALYAVDNIKSNLNTWAGYFDGNICATGTIRTTEVKVKVNPWADYVFEDNYKLIPLGELEKYIRQNRHLPGIPNVQDVNENGISLGAINSSLLQKIEELTLYIIEQDKRIAELEKKYKD